MSGHRILWNEEPADWTGGGDIDEVVISNPTMVHVEQMDPRCWWIGIYLDDDHYWMGNFVADSRGHMRFVEQENNGVGWDEDETHEIRFPSPPPPGWREQVRRAQ